MGFFLEKQGENIWYGKFSIFPSDIAVHAVSTRFGGHSRQPYAAMNLAMHVGDVQETVWQNRQIFCHPLGLEADRICTPQQVHGDRIFQVTEAEAGRGSQSYEDALPDTDALITDVPELPLMLCFADCTPVLLLDPVHRAAGLAHGGWKGTVQRIAQKTVLAMRQAFGTRPEECLAAIGPAVGPCCYEIGEEVAGQFRQAFPGAEALLLKPFQDRIHLNLWEANRLQLTEIGVKKEHIDMASVCTACNSNLFFSYRADQGRTGRIAAVISLKSLK